MAVTACPARQALGPRAQPDGDVGLPPDQRHPDLSAQRRRHHRAPRLRHRLRPPAGVRASRRRPPTPRVLVVFSLLAVVSAVDPLDALRQSDAGAADSPTSPPRWSPAAMLTVILLVQVFREGEVTSARVQGAVAVYLLARDDLGVRLRAGRHARPERVPGDVPISPTEVDSHRYMYFSFVTLTTLGLGDILPMSPLARLLVILESIDRPALPGHPHRPPGVARALLPPAPFRARAGRRSIARR